MWTHHASREVKGRLLQGQQSRPSVSACSLHVSWFHVSAKEGTEQSSPDFYQFPAGCKCRCHEENATSSARVETKSSNTCDACCAGYNPIIQGWWNYYGAFYPTAMLAVYRHIDRALERWARRKYKALSGRQCASVQWRKIKNAELRLFYHWTVVGNEVG